MAGGIGEFLGSFLRGAAGAEDGMHVRVWSELKPWINTLLPSAARSWLPRISAGELCEVPVMQRGRTIGECDRFGVNACVICGKLACLSHGSINQDGDIICYVCVADARHVVPPYQRERARREQEEPKRSQRDRSEERKQRKEEQRKQEPPPPRKPPPAPTEVARALSVLGLKPGATWAEVKAAHRKLSGENHPDRFAKSTRQARNAAHDRYVLVQKALDFLRPVYPEAQ